MNILKDNQGKTSRNGKVLRIVSISLSGIVLVLSLIGLLGAMDLSITNSIVIPVIGVITLLNGLTIYKRNKAAGIFSFCCSAFVFLICILVFVLKIIKIDV